MLDDIFIRDIKHVIYRQSLIEFDDMFNTSPGCKDVITGGNRSMTF